MKHYFLDLLFYFIVFSFSENNFLRAQEDHKILLENLETFEKNQKTQQLKIEQLEKICELQEKEILSLQTQHKELKKFIEKAKNALIEGVLKTEETPKISNKRMSTKEQDELEYLKKELNKLLRTQQTFNKQDLDSKDIFLLLFIVTLLFLFFYLFRRKKGKRMCSKCRGLGYWEGTRERVTCDQCQGSGKIRF